MASSCNFMKVNSKIEYMGQCIGVLWYMFGVT